MVKKHKEETTELSCPLEEQVKLQREIIILLGETLKCILRIYENTDDRLSKLIECLKKADKLSKVN